MSVYLTGPQTIAVVGIGVGGVVAIVGMCLCYFWFRRNQISAKKDSAAFFPLQAIASSPPSRQMIEFQGSSGEQSNGMFGVFDAVPTTQDEERLKTVESAATVIRAKQPLVSQAISPNESISIKPPAYS